jgi:hypothetical protein
LTYWKFGELIAAACNLVLKTSGTSRYGDRHLSSPQNARMADRLGAALQKLLGWFDSNYVLKLSLRLTAGHVVLVHRIEVRILKGKQINGIWANW